MSQTDLVVIGKTGQLVNIAPTMDQASQIILGESGAQQHLFNMGKVASLMDNPKEYYKDKLQTLVYNLSGNKNLIGVEGKKVTLNDLQTFLTTGHFDGDRANPKTSIYKKIEDEYEDLLKSYRAGGLTDYEADKLARPLARYKLQSILTANEFQFPNSSKLIKVDDIVKNISNVGSSAAPTAGDVAPLATSKGKKST